MISNFLVQIQNIIDEYELNFIRTVFILFAINMIVLLCLFGIAGSRLPHFIEVAFSYGKHTIKAQMNPMMVAVEVPKSWFAHFYTFSIVWSILALFLTLKGIVLNAPAPECVLNFLDLIAGGRKRQVQVSSTCGLVAIILMTVQCARRFYETNFIQIFSKSKIKLTHYMAGYIHYFGVITAILANTEGFVRDTQPAPFSLMNISLLQYLCIFIFHYSWIQQYKTNLTFINLRINKQTNQVLTEQHMLPRGDYFEMISSPHMFFEIVMYLVLLGLLPNCTTWYYIASWVVGNQIVVGLQTHKWYSENFKNYPKQRYAIIPYVL